MKTPILDALGQPAPGGLKALSAASWAGVQAPSPAPSEGLSVTPAGSSTTASRRGSEDPQAGVGKPGSSFLRSERRSRWTEEAFCDGEQPSGRLGFEAERLTARDRRRRRPESRFTACAVTSAGSCQEVGPHREGERRRRTGRQGEEGERVCS